MVLNELERDTDVEVLRKSKTRYCFHKLHNKCNFYFTIFLFIIFKSIFISVLGAAVLYISFF